MNLKIDDLRYVKHKGNYLKIAYDDNNQIKPIVILRNKTAKQLASYVLLHKDIALTLEALNTLNKRSSDLSIIKQSLTFFAVITYSKCYSRNESGRIKLIADQVLGNKAETNSLRSYHDELVGNIRNKYIAHANGLFEQCTITAILSESQMGKGFNILQNVGFMTDFHRDLTPFINLCMHTDKYLQKQIGFFDTKLKSELMELTYEELKDQSFVPDLNDVREWIIEKPNQDKF